MSEDFEKLTRLKRKADEMRRDAERAKGALERVMEQLKDEFGCSSILQAKRMLKKGRREQREAEKAHAKAIGAFERRWKDKLT